MDNENQVYRSESYTLTVHECDRDGCPHGSVVDVDGPMTESVDEFVSELDPGDTDPVLLNNTQMELHTVADSVRFCSDCLVSLSSEYDADDYSSINTDKHTFGEHATVDRDADNLVAGNGPTVIAAVLLPAALLVSLIMLLPDDSEPVTQGDVFYSGILSVVLGVVLWSGLIYTLGTYF